MSNIAKIIIKDKFSNKLISLKLKGETTIGHVLEVLQKRYEHLAGKEDIGLFFKNEELAQDSTLDVLIEEKKYTENDRIELQQRPAKKEPPVVAAPKEIDYRAMMGRGGVDFDKAIMEILIKRQVINRELAESAMRSAQSRNVPFVTALLDGGYILEKDYLTTISRHLGILSVDLEGVTIPPEMLRLLPKDVAEYYCILPVHREGEYLSVAVVNPFNEDQIGDLKVVTKLEIEPLLATEKSIRAKIKTLYQKLEEKTLQPSPDESPLPDDLFAQPLDLEEPSPKAPRPATGLTKKLAIKDGRKVDMDDVSQEEYDAQTIWADKNEDLLEPIDLEMPLPKKPTPKPAGQIWEAPTMIAKGAENISFENEEEQLGAAIPISGDEMPDAIAIPGVEEDRVELASAIPMDEPAPRQEESQLPEIGGEFGEPDPFAIPKAIEVNPDMEETGEPTFIAPEEDALESSGEKEEIGMPSLDIPPMAIDMDEPTAGEGAKEPLSDLAQTQKMEFAERKAQESEKKVPQGDSLVKEEEGAPVSDMLPTQEYDYKNVQSKIDSLQMAHVQKIAKTQGMEIAPALPEVKEEAVAREEEKKAEEPFVPQEETSAPEAPEKEESVQDPQPETREDREASSKAEESPEKEGDLERDYASLREKPADEKPPIAAEIEKKSREEETPKLSRREKEREILEETPKSREKISREVAVRYFKKMNPFKTFPLAVFFSQKKLEKAISEGVQQVTGKPIQVTKQKSLVKVVPYLPGCMVVPQEMTIDVSPEKSSVKMWVTPLAEGKVSEAQVQIWYENELAQTIPVPIHVVKQKPAQLSLVCGILAPIFSFLLDLFGNHLLAKSELLQKLTPWIDRAATEVGGNFNLGLVIGAFFMLLSILFYFLRRSKEARPVVNLVDFS